VERFSCGLRRVLLTQKDEGSLRSQASGDVRESVFNALWETFETEGGRLAPGTAERLTDAVLAVVTPELERRDAEIERLRREGSPGVMHDVDKSFHDLAVKERDHAWVQIERLLAERDTARAARDTLAWLHAEAVWHHGQTLEDYQRNDERLLAENQRLGDENELLREELGKVSGGWEARVASRSALRRQVADARAALADALEGMQDMVGYVGDYFREKWGHDDYIGRAKAALAALGDPSRDSATSEASQEEDERAPKLAELAEQPRRYTRTSRADSASTPPAEGEADTTPRVWRKGDPEPPPGVDLLEDSLGDRVKRVLHGWQWCRIDGRDCVGFGGYCWEGLWGEGDDGVLVEVLPNAEQEAER
jgi:hypothetical protein